MKPWEQLPNETPRGFNAFRAYLDLGPGRTLIAAQLADDAKRKAEGKNIGKRSANGMTSTVANWSAKNKWKERAKAYDASLHSAGDNARQEERARQATVLEERRAKVAETEWAISQSIYLKIGQALQFPIGKTTTETKVSPDGKTTTVINHQPAEWRLRDLAVLAKVASELSRNAAGMMNHSGSGSNDPAVPPVDQAKADADNNRMPEFGTVKWRQFMAEEANRNFGLAGPNPEDL